MNRQEALTAFAADKAMLAAKGISLLDSCRSYLPDDWKSNVRLAMDGLGMDAQPQLVTTPSAAIPVVLTTTIDPAVIRVIFTPLAFGRILGERKVGDWLDETRMFPIIEATGEVSSYGDFNNNGRAGVNINWPAFQSYLFQTFIRYGEREAARAGLAQINYVSELNLSAATVLNTFQNLSYAFGIGGLQNYGLLNNPYLSAALTPALKVWGGTTWFNAGSPAATANEVYNDILAMVQQLIAQTNGALDLDSKMVLVMSPGSVLATRFANAFGLNVRELLKENFPNMTIEVAPQYGVQSATNTQGYTTAGNVVQLIATEIQGQQVAWAAFNEKLRMHKLVAEPSAWMQKQSSGTWGTIIRAPLGIVTMIGV